MSKSAYTITYILRHPFIGFVVCKLLTTLFIDKFAFGVKGIQVVSGVKRFEMELESFKVNLTSLNDMYFMNKKPLESFEYTYYPIIVLKF